MNPFVKLAKEAVETYIKTGKKISPSDPVPAEMKRRAGVFVSIYKKGYAETTPQNLSPATQRSSPKQLADGVVTPQVKPVLRGCIGTYLPTQKNIAEEIIFNALAAAVNDSRFPPVAENELNTLTYSVDILRLPEEVRSPKELDPKKYGLILIQGSRKGLLLPNLPGVETVDQQIKITALKAGISLARPFAIFRFTTVRLPS